jgi:hypothetical protein
MCAHGLAELEEKLADVESQFPDMKAMPDEELVGAWKALDNKRSEEAHERFKAAHAASLYEFCERSPDGSPECRVGPEDVYWWVHATTGLSSVTGGAWRSRAMSAASRWPSFAPERNWPALKTGAGHTYKVVALLLKWYISGMEHLENTAEPDRFAKYRQGMRSDLRDVKAQVAEIRRDLAMLVETVRPEQKEQLKCGENN